MNNFMHKMETSCQIHNTYFAHQNYMFWLPQLSHQAVHRILNNEIFAFCCLSVVSLLQLHLLFNSVLNWEKRPQHPLTRRMVYLSRTVIDQNDNCNKISELLKPLNRQTFDTLFKHFVTYSS